MYMRRVLQFVSAGRAQHAHALVDVVRRRRDDVGCKVLAAISRHEFTV